MTTEPKAPLQPPAATSSHQSQGPVLESDFGLDLGTAATAWFSRQTNPALAGPGESAPLQLQTHMASADTAVDMGGPPVPADPAGLAASDKLLPAALRGGLESLSGIDLADVRVFRNAGEPARLGAGAYARGNEIYLGPGQERHLPHEAWHVVQQKQGRVRSTAEIQGQAVNDAPELEREADRMGSRAQRLAAGYAQPSASAAEVPAFSLYPGQAAIRTGHTRAPGSNPAVAGEAVVQANQLLSNVYQTSQSPVTAVKKFVSQQTGVSEDDVLDQMKKGLKKSTDGGAKNIPGYLGEMDSAPANIRPNSVKAYIDNPTGSASRPKLVTAIGKFGNFEELLRRGKTVQDYDGGHLLALEFWNTWPYINSARNLAPQEREENQHEVWRAMETLEKGQAPLTITSYVNYPTRQYTVSLNTIAAHLLDQTGAAAKIIRRKGRRANLLRLTLDTRIPSQFVTEYTPDLLHGRWRTPTDPNTKNLDKHNPGVLWAAGAPLNLGRTLFAPVEDLFLRLFDTGTYGHAGRLSGSVVARNQDPHGWHSPRALVENLARAAIYLFAWYHGYAYAAAVHACLSYFGSGAGESLLQQIFSRISAGRGMGPAAMVTEFVNTLLHHFGGDELITLAGSLVNGLIRAFLAPGTVPAFLTALPDMVRVHLPQS